jgi:hypothetical protein
MRRLDIAAVRIEQEGGVIAGMVFASAGFKTAAWKRATASRSAAWKGPVKIGTRRCTWSISRPR